MLLGELVEASNGVGRSSGRLEKIDRLASLLARLPPEEIGIAVAFLSGSPRQGRIGVARSIVAAGRSINPAIVPTLGLRDVDACFEQVAASSGSGTTAARATLLRDLLDRATREERDFLVRLLFGELRQGALEGLLVEAVARAAGQPSDRVRRAAMLAGALEPVARAALVEGDQGLARFTLTLFRPIQPMLADSAEDVGDALSNLGDASLEYKIDGARIQVHKDRDQVKVFTRNLREVTDAVPEIVEAARAMPAAELVLGVLSGVAPPRLIVPRLVTARPEDAAAFFERSLAIGHEGVVAKALGGFYLAGRRGQAWVKIKRARTLDLVVLAAEWGHGRRRGTLSNLHLGARDDAREGFVRPALVVEIAFNDIQESPVYPGGLALRFARVRRYRPDKTAIEADTLGTVRETYRQAIGQEPP